MKNTNLRTFPLRPLALGISVILTSSFANGFSFTATCNIIGNNGNPICESEQTPTTITSSSFVPTGVGNPIDTLTGNKFQQETDIQVVGDTYALRLNRYYNSQSRQLGIFGYGWRCDYEMQLQDTDNQIDIIQADGRQYHFFKTVVTDPKTHLSYTHYQAKDSSLGYIERTPESDPTKPLWQWQLPNGKRLQFVAHKQATATNRNGKYRFGQLFSITENPSKANSPYWKLTYDTMGRLAQVHNQTGDTLKFNYSTTSYHLPKIEVVSKYGVSQYFLDGNQNLAQVVSATGERTGYQYKDQDVHNLTAKLIYDEQGKSRVFAQWQYDNYDRAISSTHTNGVEKVSIEYDKNTLLPKLKGQVFNNIITNSVGEKTVYEYRSNGDDIQLLSVKGAGCATCGETNVSYEYDEVGRLIKTTYYTPDGQVASIDNITYDSLGRVSTEQTVYPNQANATTAIIHYEYVTDDPVSPKRQLIAKKWQPSVYANQQTGVSYEYNEQAQLIKETQFGYTPDGKPLNRSLLNSYDDKGNLYQVKRLDANSQTPVTLVTYTWFEDGSLKKIEQPLLKQTIEFTHNEFGLTTQIKRITDQNSLVFKIDYDANHRPISLSRYEQDKLVNGVKYQRNANGKITSVTDLDGKFVASYAYDDAERMLGEVTKQKVSISHFDTESHPIVDYRITAQNTDKLSYRYDDKGRVTGVGRDDKQLVAVNYSPDGKTAQIIGASGKQIIEHLDTNQSANYNLPNSWDALGATATQISYPNPGITRVDQNNQVSTDYGYDDFGRIAYINHPSIGKNSYEYNNLDQLTQITLSDGRQIHYQYDAQGQRTQKQTLLANKIINQVNWQYDAKGELTQVKENNQQINYTYDDKGNVTKKQIQLVGLKNPLVTQFNYDKDGEMTNITLPDGITLASHNNEIGYRLPNQLANNILYRQNTITNNDTQKITYQLGNHINLGYLYDDEGRYAGISYRAITQDDNNPLITAAHADNPMPLFSQQWQRDNNNIVQQVNEVDYQGKAKQQDYLYDSQYHVVSSSEQPIDLAKAVSSNPAQPDSSVNQARFIYDSLGNRLVGEEKNQPLKQYNYDELGRLSQIKAIGNEKQPAQSIHYNQAGQPTDYGDWHMQYTAGNLTQVSDKSGQLVALYTYNDEEQRIRKQVWVKDGKRLSAPETTYYVYEGSQLQHELDGQGNVIRNYVYVGSQLTATIDYDVKHHAMPQAKVSSWQRAKNWMVRLWSDDDSNAKVNYVITDYLGRPRQVRDGESNALVWQLSPTLFGGEVDKGLEKKTGYSLNVRFPGQFEDVETGLYYNHWRYYDKATGRYISPDPLGLAGGDNVYAYVNAAPTHFNDAPGLLLFAFDGTGNQDYGAGNSPSNVVKFRDAYIKDPNEPSMYTAKDHIHRIDGQQKAFGEFAKQNAFYISGADTTDQYSGIKAPFGDGGTGESIISRVDKMIDYLYTYFQFIEKNYTGENKPKKRININLDIVGFSRGAASARMFATKVNSLMKHGIWYHFDSKRKFGTGADAISFEPVRKTSTNWKYTNDWLLQNCNINFNFNFLGLWDSVPAFGSNEDDDISDLKKFGMPLDVINMPGKNYEKDHNNVVNFNKVVHAVAVNEHRYQFHGRSIFENSNEAWTYKDSSRFIERGFLGAHSDIGGGYKEGDLSDVALMFMIQEAKKQNIKFDDKLISNNRWDIVENPIVHDSIGVARGQITGNNQHLGAINFTPGREFRWIGQDVGRYEGNLQTSTFEHLRLNWETTKKFQPKGLHLFERIQELQSQYQQNSNPFCGYFGANCDATKKIIKLKGTDGEGAPTILYGKGDLNNTAKIDLHAYIDWLRNEGKYGLSNLKN